MQMFIDIIIRIVVTAIVIHIVVEWNCTTVYWAGFSELGSTLVCDIPEGFELKIQPIQ